MHISSGDILRRDEYQKTAEEYINDGKLAPDEAIANILKIEINKEIEKDNKIKPYYGIILDGFPRTPEQVKLLDQIIDPKKTYVADFKVSDKTAIKRIQNRAQSDGDNAREDDKNPKAMQERLNIYNKNNKKISKVLHKMSVLPQINIYANKKSPKEISLELSSAISKLSESYKNILKK